MDHLYQLPGLGAPEEPMLEAYTTLGALATATEKVQLGTLVTGNTYRNPPTLLAKAITTLDVISQAAPSWASGPAGSSWNTTASATSSVRSPSGSRSSTRRSRSSCRCSKATASHSTAPITRLRKPSRIPRFRDHIPLMIGGSGEKKTIPLAARHFDHLNIIAGFDELPRKVAVVKENCEKIDRDPATLETSVLAIALIGEQYTADIIPDEFKQQAVYGAPEQVAEQLKEKVYDAGVDGVILSAFTIGGYTPPGGVAAVGEALRPLIAGVNRPKGAGAKRPGG